MTHGDCKSPVVLFSVIPTSSCHPDIPSDSCSARPMLGTFLLVDDAQSTGIPDEQMPVVKDAKHGGIHMGKVEEVVQIVASQRLQDPKELVG